MRIAFSITSKLLLFVLPLVCIPMAIVGYLSYQASVESVTRLSKKEQMLQAKTAAAEINTIFKSCCADLEILTQLLVEDYDFNAGHQGEGVTGHRWEKISKLFKDFIARSPYYIEIRLFDYLDQEIIVSTSKEQSRLDWFQPSKSSLQPPEGNGERGCRVSRIQYSKPRQGYVVQFSKEFLYSKKGPKGELAIDLNFDKVIALVKAIRIGNQGFAFLVDSSGRTIAHPYYKPYEYDLSKYDDPPLREFIVDMITGETGWTTYHHFGEKAAAFAPVTATGWSLAVNVPLEEFKKEAKAVRGKVLQWVAVILMLSIIGVTILSYQMLRPVRHLVLATDKLAAGDLQHEIPVRSRDELGTLTRSFNRMVRNLRQTQTELVRSEKLVYMGRLSAGVAHEIRNPLNAMKGAIVYLQKHKSQDPLIQEYTQIILEEINRLNRFVTEFLNFAKQSSPNPVTTDLHALLQNTLNFLGEELKTQGITVDVQWDPEMPRFMMDPHQMEQVFLNLFVNAMHAMPEGGRLMVSTAVEGNGRAGMKRFRAVTSVRDEGIGISRDNLKKVFDPFFSTKETGTGLGLPISLGIVEGHGGKITVSSQAGHGTTVRVELPVEGQDLDTGMLDGKEDSDR